MRVASLVAVKEGRRSLIIWLNVAWLIGDDGILPLAHPSSDSMLATELVRGRIIHGLNPLKEKLRWRGGVSVGVFSIVMVAVSI